MLCYYGISLNLLYSETHNGSRKLSSIINVLFMHWSVTLSKPVLIYESKQVSLALTRDTVGFYSFVPEGLSRVLGYADFCKSNVYQVFGILKTYLFKSVKRL